MEIPSLKGACAPLIQPLTLLSSRTLLSLAIFASPAYAACPANYPETGAIEQHIEHDDIANNKASIAHIHRLGKQLFVAKFNLCDGQGRPATTGGGVKRAADQPAFIRTSSPETNSCAGCHSQPAIGGSGEFVVNAFILAQRLDPVTESVSSDFSNERNTLGMHGSGAIEMLAREMTFELRAQAQELPDGVHTLQSKGIRFKIRKEHGAVVESEGINTDLMVRPFNQSGNIATLRHFSVDAMNHHHGMQAEERFDLNPGKGFDKDHDEDGVERELSIGDITALTVYQATLPVPQQVLPHSRKKRQAVLLGAKKFNDIGCNSCHVPELTLNVPVFSEPSPLNAAHTFNDTSRSIRWDMTTEGKAPRLLKNQDGTATVRAYTDLKRHNLCDPKGTPDAIRFFCNEKLDQSRPAQDGNPGAEYFITRKLWDVGSSAPYGHRGDITTLTEAILYHGGEARQSRDGFTLLPLSEQQAVIQFLKSLQVVDE
ncbi:di-heme oxidoredictase family protein [Pseudoalteromonas fenneropenaei]|uniref:Di-heme oxidoredictase family protein n=1 Tax=Pseudoalteromonas fenneropenaei TaxID=1737459 RepID=A0ABV7CEP5_9GAMM